MGRINFYILVLLFALFSCENNKESEPAVEQPNKEDLIKGHQQRLQTEEDRIEAYIKRRGWEMQETGSGLRYLILVNGKGMKAEKGMTARVNYRISLLNGKECYSSAGDKPEEFVVGQDAVESGLHEGIEYLYEGSKAIFIMPPHLAHGLLGDRDKIPSNASLVFEIELIKMR